LYSNQLLNTHIQACFILHFDLLRRPQLDKPFMVRIDIGIEPAEMANFLNIFLGDQLDAKMKMKGMLQLNALTPLPPGAIADLTPLGMDIWHQAHESANRNGFSDDSVGLMEFGNGDGQQTITCPVHIQKAAMDLVHVSPPWVMTSAITGKTTEVPFNIETCMEYVSSSLRTSSPFRFWLTCFVDSLTPISDLTRRTNCSCAPRCVRPTSKLFGTPVRNEIRTPLLY
jgi:hypothetical protein